MKDNKHVCAIRFNGRIKYFYSCVNSYTDAYASHRALKKHEVACTCSSPKLTWNQVKAKTKAEA